MKTNHQHHRQTAFTLIELLVVIAIISLLVSILVPSLTKAKELAKQTVCMSNLKNFGTAMHMYMSNNDGFFPPSGGFGPGESPSTPYNYRDNWMYVLAPYLDGVTSVFNCYFNTPEGSIWTCPSDDWTERDERDGKVFIKQPSYGVNRWLTGWYNSNYTNGHVGPYRGEEITVPYNKLPMLSDNYEPWGCTPAHVEETHGPLHMFPWPHRHNKGDVFIFVDGDVEWIPQLESDGDSAASIRWTYRLSDHFIECNWWR